MLRPLNSSERQEEQRKKKQQKNFQNSINQETKKKISN